MLPPEILSGQAEIVPGNAARSIMGTPLREARETFEREYLRVQIRRFSGNISRTATFIGMERSALHRKLKEPRPRRSARRGGIDRPPEPAPALFRGAVNGSLVLQCNTSYSMLVPATAGARRRERRQRAMTRQERRPQAMADKVNNLQDIFLNTLRKSKTPVTMFLVKGVKLQASSPGSTISRCCCDATGRASSSTSMPSRPVMPAHPLDLSEIEKGFDEKKSQLLQEIFLAAVRKSGEPVTMFLVNGVMLQGEIAAYDLFCMLLRRDRA